MNEEDTFWYNIWKLIAIVACVLIASTSAYFAYTTNLYVRCGYTM